MKRGIMKGYNVIGVQTLFLKEVRRFMKVYHQTLLAPVVNAMLFLAVFNLAIGGNVTHIGEVPFSHFMAAGLIMMAAMQNAFANTSSSLTMGKVLGSIIDYLMPPISAGELTFGMVAAGMIRGVMVAVLVFGGVYVFFPLPITYPLVALYFLVSAVLCLSLLGMIAGILSETFDQMAAVTSYVVTPLAFLSGTFYSVKRLPDFWYSLSQWNPFFYMIDGFRYGMTGYHDSNIEIGVIALMVVNIALWITVQSLIAKGYRLKQ
jgi:ABC-2 type transport system permease protein